MSEKIKIVATVPQIIFEEVEIEIDEEIFEHGCDAEKAEFIYDRLTEFQQKWIPDGLKGFISALDVGYSTIKRVNKPSGGEM